LKVMHKGLDSGPKDERNYGASREGAPYGVRSALDPEQEALCRMLAKIARRLCDGSEKSRRHLRIVT